MCKLIGAICVLAACTGMGFARGREYKLRIQDLLVFKKLVLLLRGEIRYGATPLPEALTHISGRTEHQFGTCMGNIAKQLQAQPGKPFSDIWEKEIRACGKESSLKGEDIRQCVRLGQQLGYLDKEMQISNIDFYIEQVEGTIERLESEQGKRSRVCHCLGFFAGIMISLVLL